MISVLCPTRQRPERLERSVDSLYARSAGDIEILLAIDPDDHWDYNHQFGADVEIWGAPEQHGYRELHRYYNALAERAVGDWLLLWNDDALMLTANWDALIQAEPPTHVLAPHSHHDPLITFPIIPTAWTRACGHYAENLHCDTWWQDLGHKLGIVKWIDLHIDHQRFDKPGHETEPDDVYRARESRLHEFYEPELQAVHNSDVDTIRALLAR